jgi:outer membrane immunogenic protein
MLRRTLLASAGAIALTGAALAADLPSRAPPPVFLPPPPVITWTGLYLGINAGGTWSDSNTVDTASFPIFSSPTGGAPSVLWAANSAFGATGAVPVGSNGGFIGGGQIGYNYQFNNSFVAGIEADIQGVATSTPTGSVGNVVGPFPFFTAAEVIETSISSTKRLDDIGTIRGRLGFTITPTLLVYGTGGLAYGEVSTSTSIGQSDNNCAQFPGDCVAPADFTNGSFSNSRVGWTAGGGFEWMFAPNWSAKVEYLYYDLGSVTYSLAPLVNGGNTFTGTVGPINASVLPQSTTRFSGNIVRAGLNYHFTFPAPVVAKY